MYYKGSTIALLLLQDTTTAVLFISVVMTPCSFVEYCLAIVFNAPCLLLFYDSFTGSIEACCLIALHEALFASFM